jgi:hypothetical protein
VRSRKTEREVEEVGEMKIDSRKRGRKGNGEDDGSGGV